jgi:hypothetical protein
MLCDWCAKTNKGLVAGLSTGPCERPDDRGNGSKLIDLT